MAKYDHGGGCPCGLYSECDEGCENYKPPPANYDYGSDWRPNKLTKEKKMKLDESDDFGFTFVDSKETQTKVISFEDRAVSAEAKVDGLRTMIMPLLNNLMKNPEKDTILWPNRDKKIKEFIKKMDDYIKS